MTNKKDTKTLLCCECQHCEEMPNNGYLRQYICDYNNDGLFIEPWERCRYGFDRGFNDLLKGGDTD